MKSTMGKAVLICILLFTFATPVFAETGPAAWNVSVGKETDATSMDMMFPRIIYVHEGDKVVFKNEAIFTPHTVTFLAGSAPLNPNDPSSLAPTVQSGSEYAGTELLNSGMLVPGTSFELTFTNPGAYNYYCVLHPMMTGTVVVLPKGAPIPSKVEQLAEANQQFNQLLAQEQEILNSGAAAAYDVNADGSLTYSLALGTAHANFSHNRMVPETVVISEGDSVEWVNASPYEPHFVTFNKPDDLNFFMPDHSFNPAFMAPAGGAVYNPDEFMNSGIMPPHSSYSLQFLAAGTYYYECYLHSGSLMSGYIVVAPKGSVKVLVNDKALVYEGTLPHIKNGHVMGAVLPFVKALGGEAKWLPDLNAVHIHTNGDHAAPASLQASVGTPLIVNGSQLVYDYQPAPFINNGQTVASLNDLTRALKGSYAWDEQSQTLFVYTADAPQDANADSAGNHGHH